MKLMGHMISMGEARNAYTTATENLKTKEFISET
jgi:hypothetical protein